MHTYLVVEIAHNVLETFVLFADQVLDGHFDVLEGDVSRAWGPDTSALHLAGGHARHRAFD